MTGFGNVESYLEEQSKTEQVVGKLVLADGTSLEGVSFGAKRNVSGEVVFNTGMVGYPESLTDPSYRGQVLVLTYPLVGNYGVPPMDELDAFGLPKFFESDSIHVSALIVADYSEDYSHCQSAISLSHWLQKHDVPALCGVDTRRLTKKLRTQGSMLGKIEFGGEAPIGFTDPNETNLVAAVSRKSVWEWKPEESKKSIGGDSQVLDESDSDEDCTRADGVEKLQIEIAETESFLSSSSKSKKKKVPKIIAVDCGMKNGIIRYLCGRGVHLKVVPWDYDFNEEHFDALMLSNGPGDPNMADRTVANVRKFMRGPNSERPLFGICLGNQVLALAAGASTYKMKFGNRGMNQPVIDLRTSRCYITAQNHGFAVDDQRLPRNWKALFVNANDGSNEGIIHSVLPYFSVQFHPEAQGGPTDTDFLFDMFLERIENRRAEVTTVALDCLLPLLRGGDDVNTVLLLGSGGLSIGEAGEFDYSGSQAIKALKEENVRVVLINPNIATVQTSENMADEVYFLPVTPEFVAQVIRKERPDAILLQFGGQTALNCGMALDKSGILKKYRVRVLGTPIATIERTEDRGLFADALNEVNEKVAPSHVCHSVKEAVAAGEDLGFPVLLRSAFALGGLGSGFAADKFELHTLAAKALSNSCQVIVDKSLRGWKEVEYEVVRDRADNCITVCNMENFDPLGIHTGDSIVVAPSQTLSNADYFRLRRAAIKIVRHLGVVGECNIQYAVDPNSDEYSVIEVNARLSRSSALASKATGYPLAYVAAKLALGKLLPSIKNQITKVTQACFEPALDYCVVKIPRWDLKKFDMVDFKIGSSMKSVGEVMAIDRTFEAAMAKALRMVNDHCDGFGYVPSGMQRWTQKALDSELVDPSDRRVFAIALAFRRGYSVDQIHELTKIDRWFLCKLRRVSAMEHRLKIESISLATMDSSLMRRCKELGFSDMQIARVLSANTSERSSLPHTPTVAVVVSEDLNDTTSESSSSAVAAKSECSFVKCVSESEVRARRLELGVLPVVKQIDTLAAEYPAVTNYLYVTYSGSECDVRFDSHGVMVLGCGAYRIGSSCEFDWCAVSAVRTLRKLNALCADPGLESDPLTPRRGVSASPRTPYTGTSDEWTPRDLSPSKAGPRRMWADAVSGDGIGERYAASQSMSSLTEGRSSLASIVVNYNPETVSTDFDECDRLYFEELSTERVLDIYQLEASCGVIVSVGGQISNNLAMPLARNGVRIFGTQPDSIDQCENRHRFSELCDSIHVDQPYWCEAKTFSEALLFAKKVSFPVLIRPSYVLSGAAMNVVSDANELKLYLEQATNVSRKHPVVVTKFITNSKEIEFDAVAIDGTVLQYAISEHVENAGVHSGDATLVLPAQNLYVETIRRVVKITQIIAGALKITGPFNIQYLCKDNDIKVIECNLRASRSFPFVSKTLNIDLIDLATRAMLRHSGVFDELRLGWRRKDLFDLDKRTPTVNLFDFDYVCVKSPMFSFTRLEGADPILSVEMSSTGEVACFGGTKHEALLKSFMSTKQVLPVPNPHLCQSPELLRMDYIETDAKISTRHAAATSPVKKRGGVLKKSDGNARFGFVGDCDAMEHEHLSDEKLCVDSSKTGGLEVGKRIGGAKQYRCNVLLSIGGDDIKYALLPVCKLLAQVGYRLFATEGTYEFLKRHKVSAKLVPKPSSGLSPNALELISRGEIHMVVNIPQRNVRGKQTDGYVMRRKAVDFGVPLVTDVQLAKAIIKALARRYLKSYEFHAVKKFFSIKSWREYVHSRG